jgi:hypothetical protein
MGSIASNGVITFSKGFIAAAASWTGSGNKGVNNNTYAVISYFIN